jgi:hypothetical protein
MSEVEQRRDAGMDARGRTTQGAVAEQLPTRTVADEDAARAAKVKRSAWLLAGLAAFFYLGYIAWMMLKAQL